MVRNVWKLIAVVALLVCFGGTSADAKSKEVFKHPYEQLWSVSLRFIQVDLKCPVENKDKESGFVIFKYKLNSQKIVRGSLEIYPDSQSTGPNPRHFLQVHIEHASKIRESEFLEKLKLKLESER